MDGTCGSGRLAWFLLANENNFKGARKLTTFGCFCFFAKTMTTWSALHKATALIARTKWRQINKVSRSPKRPAGEPNNAAGGLQKAERNGGGMKCKELSAAKP